MPEATPPSGSPVVTESDHHDTITMEDLFRELRRQSYNGVRTKAKSDPPPPVPFYKKTFMGLTWGSWMAWTFKGLVVIAATVILYLKTVDAKLNGLDHRVKSKTSAAEVRQAVDATVKFHASYGDHDVVEKRFKLSEERFVSLEKEQKIIRESQIRQEGTNAAQKTSLERIERLLRRR